MKKYRKVIKKIIGIICMVYIAMWFLCLLFFFFIGENNTISLILSYTSLSVLTFIYMGIIGGLSYLAIVLIRFFIKNSIASLKVIEWFVILGVFNIVIGGIIYYRGTPSSLFVAYDVDDVLVVGEVDGKLIIDYTEYNGGDYATLVIDRPFYLKVKQDGYVTVRYPVNNPRKMKMIINANVGLNMVVAGFVIIFGVFYLAMILLFASIPYNLVSKQNKKGNNKKDSKLLEQSEKNLKMKKRKIKRHLIDKK